MNGYRPNTPRESMEIIACFVALSDDQDYLPCTWMLWSFADLVGYFFYEKRNSEFVVCTDDRSFIFNLPSISGMQD